MVLDSVYDKRVRIRARPGKEQEIYGSSSDPNNPMRILHETNGVFFPYTPDISVRQGPKWQQIDLVHSLQNFYLFRTISSVEINISGPFAITNIREAYYLLAVFHFLKSYSKMYFGIEQEEPRRGLGPPTLLLTGYGDFVFNELPIIIVRWKFDFPSDVDYVRINFGESIRSRNRLQNNIN